jgi:adenosine deaminase CECR1
VGQDPLPFSSMSTPELAAYQEARAALIHEDRYLRRDGHIKRSDVEVKADQIIRDIRTAEASTIWMQEHESIPHPFPGMEFLTGMSPFSLVSRFGSHNSFKAATLS